VLVASALYDIIGEMDNVTRGMAVAAQQILQGMVKQIGALTWICSMLESVSLSGVRVSACQALAL
jgi:hypothetical protein